MSDCAEIRDRLYSLLIGECDGDAARAIEAHVAGCPECAAELESLKEVLKLTGLLQKVKPSHDLYSGVAERMRPAYLWLKIAASAAAAAAVVAILLFSLGRTELPEVRETPDQAVREKDEGEVKLVEKPAPVPETPEQKEPELVELPEEKPREGEEPELAQDVKKTPQVPQESPEPREPELAKAPEPSPESQEAKKPDEVVSEGPVVLATVGSLAGEVQVRRKDSEEWLTAGMLFNILPGDTLTTNSLGRTRLDLGTGDYVYVNNNAQVTVAREKDELVFVVEKGEVCVEKESAEGSMAVDTGFGRVRARRGRFNLRMSGSQKCLIHVLEGEVECCGHEGGSCGRYGRETRGWFQRGGKCRKGTRMRSREAFQWTEKLRPEDRDDEGKAQAQKPHKGNKPDDGQGIPPGGHKKPEPDDKPGPGKGPGDGKVGPGPAPMPPPPGNGQHPGGKQGGQGGPNKMR